MKVQQGSKSEIAHFYIYPGEILREDCLRPLNLSADALAQALHVPPSSVV
jgi:plasmid maintenance system antidote protein VapI